jgi:hypothetical protein
MASVQMPGNQHSEPVDHRSGDAIVPGLSRAPTSGRVGAQHTLNAEYFKRIDALNYYLEDLALLDLLVTAKLSREADALRAAEGWKWTEAHLDFPRAHGMRRAYPHPIELSVEGLLLTQNSARPEAHRSLDRGQNHCPFMSVSRKLVRCRKER